MEFERNPRRYEVKIKFNPPTPRLEIGRAGDGWVKLRVNGMDYLSALELLDNFAAEFNRQQETMAEQKRKSKKTYRFEYAADNLTKEQADKIAESINGVLQSATNSWAGFHIEDKEEGDGKV